MDLHSVIFSSHFILEISQLNSGLCFFFFQFSFQYELFPNEDYLLQKILNVTISNMEDLQLFNFDLKVPFSNWRANQQMG